MSSSSSLASIGFSLARTRAAPLAAAVGIIPKVDRLPREELSEQQELCDKLQSELDAMYERHAWTGQPTPPEDVLLGQRLAECRTTCHMLWEACVRDFRGSKWDVVASPEGLQFCEELKDLREQLLALTHECLMAFKRFESIGPRVQTRAIVPVIPTSLHIL